MMSVNRTEKKLNDLFFQQIPNTLFDSVFIFLQGPLPVQLLKIPEESKWTGNNWLIVSNISIGELIIQIYFIV